MRRAAWATDNSGNPTGELAGVDERSLFRVAGEYYEEAVAAMAAPPHRWGEWVALFHPNEGWDQIVGYRHLDPKHWFTVPEGGGLEDVQGPFAMKRRALVAVGATSSKSVAAGHYRAKGHIVFTRDNALEVLSAQPEELP